MKPPVDAKAEKERLKKEKAAAAAAAAGGETAVLADRTNDPKGKNKSVGEKVAEKVAGAKEKVVAAVAGGEGAQKKEKKEKAPKAQKAPAPAAPLSPSLIDLRVGHI